MDALQGYDPMSLCYLALKKKLYQFYLSLMFFKEAWLTLQDNVPLTTHWEITWYFFSRNTFVISLIICSFPIPNMPLFYIDGLSSGSSGIMGTVLTTKLYANYNSAQ